MTKLTHIELFQLLSITVGLIATGCADPAPGNLPQRLPDHNLADANEATVVATVDGHPIEKDTLVDLLLRAHGPAMLDELVLTELVRSHARQKNVPLTEAMLDRELNRLLDDMAPARPRPEQLALLDYMLRRRRLTRPQFDLIIEREALLRRLVDQRVDITQDMLAAEFQRRHGPRVQVRQLVVGTLRQIELAQHRLAQGDPVLQIIRDMSQDQRSAANDGLLPPFSRADEQIPAPIRSAAFQLTQDDPRSPILQYRDDQSRDRWALLQLERTIEPDGTTLSQARDELTKRIKQQVIGKRMFDLQQSLRSAAEINIIDPKLQPPPPAP